MRAQKHQALYWPPARKFRMFFQRRFRATETMSDDESRKPINPAALSLPDAVRLLAKVGFRSISEAMLQQDVDSGAPTNPDGTLNLVQYAAWLVKEMSRGN